MLINPPYLNTNSRIAIVSPAGKINPVYIDNTIKVIEREGFIPIVFPHVYDELNQMAGKDEDRLKDFNDAINSEEIGAILCSRGGYGLIRILEKIDLSNLKYKPKWIIGFSDITNLHLALNNIGIKSIHGQMAKAMSENPASPAVTKIFNILRGILPEYRVESHSLNRCGKAKAEIIGGNLSIIYSLMATPYEINTDGKILFIEDLNEYLYHLDRMMISLNMAGKIKNLKGLIIGQFNDMKDNKIAFGKSVYEIINEHVKGYNFPVCYNFPTGHVENNMPIIEGSIVEFCVEKAVVNLKFM